jgi:hypothetical protein
MANATRLYATLVEGKLNARKFYETNDLSYYIHEVSAYEEDETSARRTMLALAFPNSKRYRTHTRVIQNSAHRIILR